MDFVVIDTPNLSKSRTAWTNSLGKTNAERLESLIPLFADGKTPLSDALEVVAPGKDQRAALAAYQTFVTRVNAAARKASLQLVLKVDSKKKSSPEERATWVEGPSPDVDNLAQFTREAVSTLDQHKIVPPTAAILDRKEHEDVSKLKPLIRFFVSYTRDDGTVFRRLNESLQKELRLSKRYRFEIWIDRNVNVGADWNDEIQKEVDACDFGLLFVSRDFLLNDYITANELPLFVDNDKAIPVGLKPLDYDRVDLKGLESKQIFRLERPGDSPRCFSQCRGEMADEFVRALASAIESKVEAKLSKPQPSQQDDNEFDEELAVPIRDSDHEHDDKLMNEFSKNIIRGTKLPANPVPPDGAPTSFSTIEKDASLLTANRTLAVDYLADWACSADGAPFCAVLGEVGIGKTTTLMLLAREMDRLRESNPNVPAVIFIDLKDYAFEGDPNLDDILNAVITRHWKGTAGKTVTPEMIVRAVQERRALIIFDGLDERIIPLPQQSRDAFIRQLWSVLPPRTQRAKPGVEPGRLIISCRSHYFPTVTALSSAFTGEQREGIRSQDYTACVVLPFNDEQIRAYLAEMLGNDRVDDAVEIINSVHNLTELSKRPYLLSLIAPELAELEQMKKDGRTVLGVTLYGLFVEKWLRRDEYKHQFTPEHKLQMMEALAAYLCKENQRKLPWNKISKWLDKFLNQHPEIRDRYKTKPAEVLNQDFRAATFCLRPDDEKDGFRFAHTSLYEYFLAVHLVRLLEEDRFAEWDMPLPSDETLDFAGQLLASDDGMFESETAISAWSRLLDDASATVDARRNAFRMWLIAHQKGWPLPAPMAPRLEGLDLEGWTIDGSNNEQGPLDLRSACLSSTRLNHAKLRRVLLTGCDASNCSARHVEMQDVDLTNVNLQAADLTGSRLQSCRAIALQGSIANWHDCDVVDCDFTSALLPQDWKFQAAVEVDDTKPWEFALRQGHHGPVTSCSWSPDGTRLISASDDNTLKLWDADSGRCINTLKGHNHWVTSCSWSPDGTRLISASYDNTLKLWDADTGRCINTLKGHNNWVTSCSWSPDGTRLISASYDNTLKLWDADTGRCNTLKGHNGTVTSCSWSPDGTRLISAAFDATIREWDANTGEPLRCWVTIEDEHACVDVEAQQVRYATPEAWRLLGWQGYDPQAQRRRLLPLEIFGPLPE